MNLHNLETPKGARKKIKRVGRGNASGWGTTATRGTKGQKSRSGGRVRRGFEGGQMPLYRRLPKRGFTNYTEKSYALVNLGTLQDRFEANETVTPEILFEKKIIKKMLDGIKILGHGELDKALTVKAHKFSKTAVEKIQKAGGTTEELS